MEDSISGQRDKRRVWEIERNVKAEKEVNTNPAVLLLQYHQTTPNAREKSGLLRFKQRADENSSS